MYDVLLYFSHIDKHVSMIFFKDRADEVDEFMMELKIAKIKTSRS